MLFNIRFKIGNRYGAGSRYTGVEFCVHVVDRYGIREMELNKIFALKPNQGYQCSIMMIKRLR